MELISGKNIMRFDGSSVSADEALANKRIVAFYFSGQWCGPCQTFTPILKKFYDEVSESSGLEIIFSSCDETAEDMRSYMDESHGHWLAVELRSGVNLIYFLRAAFFEQTCYALLLCTYSLCLYFILENGGWPKSCS